MSNTQALPDAEVTLLSASAGARPVEVRLALPSDQFDVALHRGTGLG